MCQLTELVGGLWITAETNDPAFAADQIRARLLGLDRKNGVAYRKHTGGIGIPVASRQGHNEHPVVLPQSIEGRPKRGPVVESRATQKASSAGQHVHVRDRRIANTLLERHAVLEVIDHPLLEIPAQQPLEPTKLGAQVDQQRAQPGARQKRRRQERQ